MWLAIGPWIDGHLLKNKRKKYVKKDGSIAFYPTLPILQYRVGPKQRKPRRLPWDKVAEIERLLKGGARFKALMARYGALAARLALESIKVLIAFPSPRRPRLQTVLDGIETAA